MKWVPSNCVVVSKESKDEYDKKLKKHVREIVTIKRCDLEKVSVNESKILTSTALKHLIDEEIDVLIKDREKRNDLFGSWDEIVSLSKGIVEEEDLEEEKDKPKYAGTHGNPFHDKEDGEFLTRAELDAGKKGSASFWYAHPDKLGRVATTGRKHRWISKPSECGRSSKTRPRRKCSEG